MENADQVSRMDLPSRRYQTYAVITAFCSLLAIVDFALYGLPFFYDFKWLLPGH